jgi:hypothetical protein
MIAAGEEGIPYEDPEFPADDSSLYIGGGEVLTIPLPLVFLCRHVFLLESVF